MKKRFISLVLVLGMCLTLTVPVVAVDKSTEKLMTYISLVRNGILDEFAKEYNMQSNPKWLYSLDGVTMQAEEYYTPFSQDDTWVLTNTGKEKCHVYLFCTYLPWQVWDVTSGAVGLYNFSKLTVWSKSGEFVDITNGTPSLDTIVLVGPGESTSFSAKDFISYGDDGTGQVLYIINVMFLFPDSTTEDYIGLQLVLMRDEDGTAEIVLKAMQSGVGIVSPTIQGSPSAASHPNFTDVAADSPFKDAIDWAIAQNITKGTTPSTFSPGNTCTVSHILTFLWRAFGEEEIMDDERTAVIYLANMLGADLKNLNAPCTRAMAVTYLWKAANCPTPTKAISFTDVPADAEYATAVAWAVENGITSGTSASTFSPDKVCTRGQIVTFLYRIAAF